MSLRTALRPYLSTNQCLGGLFTPTAARHATLARRWGLDRTLSSSVAQRRSGPPVIMALVATQGSCSRRATNGFTVVTRPHRAYSSSSSTLADAASDLARSAKRERRRLRRLRRLPFFAKLLTGLTAFFIVSVICYETVPPSRHFLLALVRCSRLIKAVMLDVLDYKWTFAKRYPEGMSAEEEKQARRVDRHACHARSAQRMLEALKTNAGIYVKLGQHVASMQVLPKEWTQTMRPLQDQCFPTPLPEIDAMLRRDMDMTLDDLFLDFDPRPIGVASLAQVHRATDRRSGRRVAVKLQHPHLEEFAKIDIATVNFAMKIVKVVFPDFEFSWLGEEMTTMLPLEMDFAHEAYNADRVRDEFKHLAGKTSVYIPEILWAERRCMALEYIDGARVDDLVYLKEHKIDRNLVSQELSRIFSQMVYLNGYFHADPHQGNLLIRNKPKGVKGPFNFQVVLLDWGQCFDVPHDLRVNYAKLWLSLLSPNTPENIALRKKYAMLVGNIDEKMYPILETAITGRIGLAQDEGDKNATRKGSLLQMQKMSEEEMNILRNAMVEQEGLIASVFSLLRNAPRRLIMILKLNDLTRSLDQSLATTHGQSRVWLIVARFCSYAVWQDDKADLQQRWRKEGLSTDLISRFLRGWLSFHYYYTGLRMIEWGMDARARVVKIGLWFDGFRRRGWQGAFDAAAGLSGVPGTLTA